MDATRKYKKLLRVVRFFSLLPTVRGVAAVNTLSWWQTKRTSDIDLLIITRPKTLWVTRFFLVVPFLLFGKRPHALTRKGEEPMDPFCFSFFLSDHDVNIQPIKIPDGDPYLAYWTKALVPLLDKDRVFDRLAQENTWADHVLPNASSKPHHHKLHTYQLPSFPLPFHLFDRALEFIQRKWLPSAITELANKDTRVILSDQMLKFYVKDRRTLFKEKWNNLRRTFSSL